MLRLLRRGLLDVAVIEAHAIRDTTPVQAILTALHAQATPQPGPTP